MDFGEWLQSRLTAHGYAVGPIDGQIGPTTIDAIKAFEKANGLPEDGKADEKVVELLRKSATESSERMPERDVEEPELAAALATNAAVGAGAGAAATAVKNVWPRQAGCTAFYGAVGTNQGTLTLPFPMRIAWDKAKKTSKMTLNKKVIESAGRVFEKIAHHYDAAQREKLGLDLFGGSLNVRRMRGGSAYSMHSWGIAIDFAPETNQLKWGRDRASLAVPEVVPFWEAWEEEGWLSLGRARNFDWMHVQAARL